MNSIEWNLKNREIAQKLVGLCIERNIRLTAAESCTGGMISAYITSVPGSSAVFDGSLVSYANSVKVQMLGVPQEIIDSRGVVSADAVAYMSKGALRRFEADLAIAVSGIAGPGGGTPEKPVGRVYICVRTKDDRKIERFDFSGDREEVRMATAYHAMKFALEMINNGGKSN